MFSFRIRRKLQAVIFILISAAVAYGYVTGPDARYTGAPGDIGSCVQCHDTFHEANMGPGSVTISGNPAVYEPDMQYVINVTVQQPNRQRYGFQLTAIDKDGNRIGTLSSIDNFTQVHAMTGAGGRQYIEHTQAGTVPLVSGSRTFQIRWTAPDTDKGYVKFFFAGNAANGDGTNQNDYIYTNSALTDSPTTVVNVSLLTNPAGLNFEPGAKFVIDWTATNHSNVESYEVRYSTDDGATFPITNLIFSTTNPDQTSVEWTVPDVSTNQARIRVLAATKAGAAVEIKSGQFAINGTASGTLPTIISVKQKGKKLIITGANFQQGAKVEMDDVDQKTKNAMDFSHVLKCKNAGLSINPGDTVTLVVRNPDETKSAPFTFTRPL